MKPIKRITLSILLTAAMYTVSVKAQVRTIHTREFEAESWLDANLNLKENGVLIYGWQDRVTFVMQVFDTALNNGNKFMLTTSKSTRLADIAYDEQNGQLLVLMQESKRMYSFTTINLTNKKKKTTSLELPKGTMLRDMMYMVGEEIWLVGFTKKAYFMFHFKTSSPRLTPLNTNITAEKYSIEEINLLDNNEVSIGYFYGPKKKREFDVIVLDHKGKTVEDELLSSMPDEERSLIIGASVTRLGDGDYALTGTYNKKGKGVGNGIYFARFSDNKVRYMSNFDYADFEHFYDYLSDKQRDKVEAKIQKKKGKGKDVTISNLSAMHKAMVTDEGLVFVGEYYYPTYRTETYYTTGANGASVMRTRQVFDGYQYTHGMAIGIDNNGTKLYDLHVPLHIATKPMTVKRFLKMNNDTSVLHIVHTSGRYIYSSQIEEKTITNNEYQVINNIPEGEKEKWSASTGIHWYGPYFFIMETQKTKEKGLIGKKKVKFYASKIEVI